MRSQGHPFARFVSGCVQTAESDWARALALAVAPGGQILGRQPPFSQGSSRLCWMLVPMGEGIPATTLEVAVSVLPQGRSTVKRGSSLLPLSPPALFQWLGLSGVSMTQALARTVLEQLPWSLNVAPNLHAPNIQDELGDCWIMLVLCDSSLGLCVRFKGKDMCLYLRTTTQSQTEVWWLVEAGWLVMLSRLAAVAM